VRILMATPLYLPHTGGVERYVDALSRQLLDRGHDVTVLTTDPTRTLPGREDSDGVAVIRVPAWPRGRDWHFAPGVYATIRDSDWDIVHVQSYHTLVAPLAMVAALRTGIPYALTFHGGGHSSRVRRALRKPQWKLLRPLLARADRLVAIARFEVDLYGGMLGLSPEHFAMIPNGTAMAGRPLSAPPGRGAGALIASVGRLERYKGHQRLIEALPSILRTRPDARVWIAGRGPYEPALQRLAQELEVSDRVEIRAVPPDDAETMAAELAKAALMVLLSDYETQPLAVLEALALGVPVLVTHTSGLAEFADRKLVRSVPTRSSADTIASAVLEQLRDPYVPPSVDLPTWDECAASHEDLYRSLRTARTATSATATARDNA
jgi:glycosyltransferase involved in cell wall biosynthesis